MAEVLSRPEGAPFQHAPPISRSTSSTSLSLDAFGVPRRTAYLLQDLRAPSLSSSHTSSLHSTPSSSLSLDTKSDESSSEDDSLSFAEYGTAGRYKRAIDSFDLGPTSIIESSNRPSSPVPSPAEGLSLDTPLLTPDPLLISEDDTAMRKEPSHNVDYLSYEWREEDIWTSWRYIVEHRNVYGERSRLENASWRTWAKAQFELRTMSPDTLNWLKDVDVTWLYGPMQASNRFGSQQNSKRVSRLSTTNSFLNGVEKPILKKRSISEVMLQKPLSYSSLVKQATEAVQAQQTTGVTLERRKPRPIIVRAATDLLVSSIMSGTRSREPTDYFFSRATSGLHSPDQGKKKHIRFDDKVEQCIAVECKDADDDENDCNHNPWSKYHDDDSSSDEIAVMMKRSRRKRPLLRTSSKTSTSGDSKTIAKLPPTTLKYRTDSPDVTEQQPSHSLGFWRSSRLSPSPSRETLWPPNPLTNFLLPKDDEDDDQSEPSSVYGIMLPSTPTPSNYAHRPSTPPKTSEPSGLRITASGMFMPFEDNEEQAQQLGIIDRVVDTVNTARDIAYMMWNVGWRN